MKERAHYNVYCLCIHCSYTTFLQMAKSALDPEEHERRQKMFDTIEDKRRLREWNQWAKREDAV